MEYCKLGKVFKCSVFDCVQVDGCVVCLYCYINENNLITVNPNVLMDVVSKK